MGSPRCSLDAEKIQLEKRVPIGLVMAGIYVYTLDVLAYILVYRAFMDCLQWGLSIDVLE
jgi:hypothetical protein